MSLVVERYSGSISLKNKLKYDILLSLCKQTSDLFKWQNLISTCVVDTFKPGDKITK